MGPPCVFLHTIFLAGAHTAGDGSGEQGISSFRIDRKTGTLTEFGTPVLLAKRPVHIATDNAGRYLLAAHNHPPAGLTVWEINADGSLGAETSSGVPRRRAAESAAGLRAARAALTRAAAEVHAEHSCRSCNNNESIFPAQMVGPIQITRDFRFVYIGNRNNGTIGDPPVFRGGENNVAVFRINRLTGEPTLIQNADTRGFVPRTITFDKTEKILVAANSSARTVQNPDGTTTLVPTSLAVFRMKSNGTLEYVRKYDNAGGTWAGFLGTP